MSAQQSNLSSPQYGYDFVVATTQQSINAELKQFLSKLPEPEITVIYVADANGNPVMMDAGKVTDFLKTVDPFGIPNTADPVTDSRIQTLLQSRFMGGFKAQLGLPPGYPPQQLPDFVQLGVNTSAVQFNLLCSEFQVVQYVPGGGYNPAQWLNESQPAGNAWIFTSSVDLRLRPTDNSAYDQLSLAVQNQIHNLGGNAFSIQQLLFDFTNAGLATTPSVSGNLGAFMKSLHSDFLTQYFDTMRADGEPVMGCVVTQSTAPDSTLTLTDFTFETLPLLGDDNQPIANPQPTQQKLATLNYLCAANGHKLPPSTQLGWNWLDSPADGSQYAGVVAINRNALAGYFKSQLDGYVAQNCFQPHVTATVHNAKAVFDFSLTAGQTPAVTMPPTGPSVLQYSFSQNSHDQAGANGWLGKLAMTSSFSLDVSFSGNTIVITQHAVVYMNMHVLANSLDENVVDRTITDTYTLNINDAGQLVATLSSVPQNNDKLSSTNAFINFFTSLNQLTQQLGEAIQNIASSNFKDLPLSVVQDFVFPGGKSFIFKDVSFSATQDLVSRITYADV